MLPRAVAGSLSVALGCLRRQSSDTQCCETAMQCLAIGLMFVIRELLDNMRELLGRLPSLPGSLRRLARLPVDLTGLCRRIGVPTGKNTVLAVRPAIML
jgi:hypothetical protein